MGTFSDLAKARAEVVNLEAALVQARATVSSLEASVVKGGPDVSVYQGDVDWDKVALAGYDLCFPRVADGDLVDTTFTNARITAIKAAGLKYIPYYYGRVASAGNGQRNGRHEAAMAVYFASRQGWGRTGDLPLAYDFEDLNGQTATKAVNHLLEFLRAYRGLMGHYPILYTFPFFWNENIAPLLTAEDRAVLDNCPFWIAHHGASSPMMLAPWTDWTFWQYTKTGTVAGISGPVDLNHCNITKTALASLAIK